MSERQPTTLEGSEKHWLVRPASIRKLWIAFVAILALTVLAQIAFPLHGVFEIDDWFAFPAIFGFLACVVMIVGAKVLGIFLKRKDVYYDD